MSILRGLIGIAILIGICYLLSNGRKKINWRIVIGGLLLQIIIAVLVLKTGLGEPLKWVSSAFVKLLSYSDIGAKFLFGNLLEVTAGGFTYGIAFKVLPTILFVSALTSVLYYLGLLQWVVFGFAWIMKRIMPLSGAECLAAAANVFVGQTEAPLVVKPYIEKMTRSELMSLMTGGMATIAGSVFGFYIATLAGDNDEMKVEVGRQLLTASLMSAPAALLVAKMLVPEREEFDEELLIPRDRQGSNLLEALANGTTEGLKLAFNVAAMLIVFIAMIALLNGIMGWFGGLFGGLFNGWISSMSGGIFSQLSLEALAGFLFAPIAWVIGGSPGDLLQLGQLLGTKMVANELLAYLQLGDMTQAGGLSPRAVFLATFALCGFANFSSIGIQIGGIGALAPGKRSQLAALGLKSMIGGTVACLLTATVAGMFFVTPG